MRVVLADWKRRLQFDELAKPNPTSAPQIIAQQVFQFVERSKVAFEKNEIEAKSRSREKSKASQIKDELRQLLDCTPLTHSLPVNFRYFVALQSICSVGKLCVSGHAVKVTMDSFMIYLKDQRPPFSVSVQRLLDVNSFEIRRPDVIISSEDKLNIQRRTIRQSKRKEEIKVKARKEEAEKARSKWMQSEYDKMVNQINLNSHTFQDFTNLFEKLSQPFEHRSNDGYLTKCTYNQSTCVTSMALQAIDGVLCQKRQAEELRRINALEKKRKTTKRKRTPNTTRGDDGIGVLMSLQDYDFVAEQEVKAEGTKKLNKEISQLETNLKDFSALKTKYNGSINLDTCLSAELTTILNLCGLGKGNSSKKKEVKKQILQANRISSDTLTSFVDDETKRLSKMKEQLADGVVPRSGDDDEPTVASDPADSDSEDEHHY